MDNFCMTNDLEIMQIEYELMEDEMEIDSLGETKVALEIFRDDMLDTMEGCKRSFRKEKLRQVRNKLASLKGNDSEKSNDAELEAIRQEGRLAKRYYGFFEILGNIVTENNQKDVLKLARFTKQNFLGKVAKINRVYEASENAGSTLEEQAENGTYQDCFGEFFKTETARLKAKAKKSKMVVEKIRY